MLFRGNDPRFIYNCKLPVCGQVFNNRNGRSQSVVDLLKPYQILVNAFYNQAYHVAQKNNGKFFIMGASLLPNIKDWGGEEAQEKFMTIAQNLGLAIVDDSTSAQAQSMQYGLKVMDMDESDRIQRLINLAMLIEQQGFMQLGITPQRQGSIQASETATGTQTAVNNSYAITEIYFEQFSNYRRRKLQMLLELSQYVEGQGEGDVVKQYTTSDLGRAFIKVNSTDLLLKDFGVYLMNSAEQQRKKDLVEQILLKNNQSMMPLSKLIQTVRLDSLADIQKKLEEQEVEMQKQEQAKQQQAMEMQQQQIQAQSEQADKARAFEAEQNELDRQNKIMVEKLRGIAAEGSYSQTTDTTPLLIKQTEIDLKKSQMSADQAIKNQQMIAAQIESYRKQKSDEKKQQDEKSFRQKELSIKEKEMQNKLAIEDKKIKQIEIQNKNQEKLANEKARLDREMADKKIQLEKTKIKIKPKLKK